MTDLFVKIYDYLLGEKRITAIFLLVFVALCIFVSFNINYEEDISKFLPQNKQNEKYAEVYKQITNQDKIIVIFSSADTTRVVPSDTLEEVMDRFANICSKTDSSRMVRNLQVHVDESKMMDMLAFVYANYPYFMTDKDYERVDSILNSPQSITKSLVEDKQMLMLPTASNSLESMRYDPLHLFSPVLSRLQSFQMSNQFNIIDGCIFTKDGKRGLVILSTPYGVNESKKNAMLNDLINGIISKTEKEYPSVHISAIGAPLIAVSNASQIKKDSILAVSIAVVLILVLLLLHYRRLSDLLWIGISIIFGWLFALSGMALFSDNISIIVLGIGSVIIGISVNYPLHYLDHLNEEKDKREALREMVPPLLIGNITTVSAFLCLIWLDAAAMRDLGLFGSLMLIGTILFVLVFLPLYAKKHKIEHRHLNLNIDVINLNTRRHSRIFILIITVVTIVLGWFSVHTSFDSNLQHINYMTDQQRRDMELMASATDDQNSSQVYVVSEGHSLTGALTNNEKIQDTICQLQNTKVSGVDNYLPTADRQKKVLEKWHSFWASRAGMLTARLKTESEKQGFAPDAFKPFLDAINSKHEVQPIEYFQPIYQNLEGSYILKNKNAVMVVNYVHIPNHEEDIFKNRINRTDSADIFAFSVKDIGNQLVNVLSDSFNYIGFVCGFVVFFFLWLSFGRIELSLMSFLPLAVSWIWILGIMDMCGIKFNIVNIILATFIFGQGDDYTIFITEGLMAEYAYRRPRLEAYKSSVALSALIMFIGIGTLILARHPALRSLAEVTIIGMFTVVLMAYYIPPIVFKWVTTNHGNFRQVPITLKRIGYSLFALLFFIFMMYLFMLPYTWLYFHIGKTTEKKKLRYHRLIQRMSDFVIHRVPGVKFTLDNAVGESFDKPAVIICNHQSHLDLMCLMMLTPKMVFLTNDWVWNNPFYGMVIKYAEFYPVSDGIENNKERILSLYNRGYSIAVFPEGTRSEDCSILRFHKGAFYLAEFLKADILPIFIHGVGHVLPKKDFMLREGNIDVEVCKRIKVDDYTYGDNARQRTSAIHKYYKSHYDELCDKLENSHYYVPLLKYQYIYKGYDIEHRCRKVLRNNNDFASVIDANEYKGHHVVWVRNCGNGEMAYLFALVHKNTQVYAFVNETDSYDLLSAMAHLPANLHVIKDAEEGSLPRYDKCITL